MLPELLSAGLPVPFMNKDMLLTMMRAEGVKTITNHSLLEISGNEAVLMDRNFRQQNIPSDTVVCATGFKPNRELFDRLYGTLPNVYSVGDSQVAANIMTAIWEANEVAMHVPG